MMKKLLQSLSLGIIISVLSMLVALMPLAHAAFNRNQLISDSIFSNTSSMGVGDINAFLNHFPSSCISPNNGFSSPDPTGYSPSGGYTYGGNVSGGQVIYDAAQAYGINPQVLLATLQKESSVVSGDASYHCTYINTAMGYGCPDSGSCPTNPATMSGFSKQVIHAAWLFRFGQQRALGNTGWNVQLNNFPQNGDHWDNSDDPPTCYGGPMTQGTLSRGCGQAATFFDGYTTIDGQSTHMDTGATAALYWYTPHFSGNQNFVNIFTSWFGSTIAASDSDVLSFIRLNHSSGNVEDIGYPGWNNYAYASRYALTSYPAVPGDGSVVPLYWPNGDLVFLRLNHSSGHVELVSYSAASGFRHLNNYTLTGYPAITPDHSVIPRFMPNGDLSFIRLNHSSGHVEVVTYSVASNYTQVSRYVLTAYPAVPGNGAVVPLYWPNGDLVFIRLNHSSGKTELVSYSAASNYQQVVNYTLTGYPAVTPDGSVVPSFTPNGDLSFIRLNHSSGNVEVVTYGSGSNFQQTVKYTLTGYPAVAGDGNVVPLYSR